MISALGRVKDVQNRSVLVKLSNGFLIRRHCTDLIKFEINPNLESNLDILNFPLFGEPENDLLILNESQFRDLSTGAFYIPTIGEDHILHGKQVQVLDENDSEPPEGVDDGTNIIGGETMLVDNENDTGVLRRS